MNLDQKILVRFDELIAKGQGVRDTFRYQRYFQEDGGPFVDGKLASQWAISSLHILGSVFGRDSDHYRKLDALQRRIDNVHAFDQAWGIVQAAKDDYERDMLLNTRVLIEAEVFDDFLEQADYLLGQGFYQPAAVVAGAVLEDGLRKLCDRKGITQPDKPKLDTMNADLAKAGVYNKLVQKQVTALADLRNKAAHGQWDQFTEADVVTMLQQVRSFMAAHFS